MPYELTRSAEQDLIDIYVQGCRLFGVRQAESYFAQFEAAFERISHFPNMARQRHELSPPVRIHPCGAHVIVYDVHDNNHVLIIRIRHGREDWISHPEG